MKNLKILLPMLAIVFAIGVAFTAPGNEEKSEVQAFDYILVDGSWEAIPAQDCVGNDQTCKVRLEANGPEYDVYDEMNISTLKLAPASRQTPVINY